MRNFLTGAIASIALATAFIGSASAATMPNDQPTRSNLAMQDELQRDDSQNWLHRAPVGELVTPSSATSSTAQNASPSYGSSHD